MFIQLERCYKEMKSILSNVDDDLGCDTHVDWYVDTCECVQCQKPEQHCHLHDRENQNFTFQYILCNFVYLISHYVLI